MTDSYKAWLQVAPEVQQAVDAGHPVVALESTLISHGLPYPQNLVLLRKRPDGFDEESHGGCVFVPLRQEMI